MRKAEVSIPIALATVTLVYTIYSRGLPTNVDVRVGKTGDVDVDAVRKQNAMLAAGTVSGIALLTKDPNVFILGGAAVVALDWSVRINNFTNPLTKRVEAVYEASRIAPEPAGTPDETVTGLQAVV